MSHAWCLGLLVVFHILVRPSRSSACPNSCSGHGICHAGGCLEITVGTSAFSDVRIQAARGDLICPTIVDKTNWLGGGTQTHVFAVSVNGRSIVVRRTDKSEGWAFNLRIKCTPAQRCGCYDGFTAADCSQRLCPAGPAWTGAISLTDIDVAHAEFAECSNMGNCDRTTGKCICKKGFEGAACDRMSCPTSSDSQCNGHGRCLSMAEMARDRDNVHTKFEKTFFSYSLWDKDMVRGCVCEAGWTGYDCSERECLKGDDPLTTSQVDEVQTINCNCKDTCSGAVMFSFRNHVTKALAHTATAADLTSALQSLPTLDAVTVKYKSGKTKLCDDNSIDVTFTTQRGDLPLIRFLSTLKSSSSTEATLTVAQKVQGTKEYAECSNRGTCDPDTGLCKCDKLFETSNGLGATGTRVDCGFVVNATNVQCPGTTRPCSGHGTCASSTKTCTCYDGWGGHDCNKRKCPADAAWADEATGVDTAHARAMCSNKGTCNSVTGKCTCQPGFEGIACERVSCPVAHGKTCSGAGICRTLAQQAINRKIEGLAFPTTYGATVHVPHNTYSSHRNTWDAHKIQGCSCHQQHYVFNVGDTEGFDCSKRVCPRGPSLAELAVTMNNRQELRCVTSGAASATTTFTLSFRGRTSGAIVGTSTAAQLKAVLDAVPTIGGVSVSFSQATGTVCSNSAQVVTIEFTSAFRTPSAALLGFDIPVMKTGSESADISSLKVVAQGCPTGVKDCTPRTVRPCSTNGVCDSTTGLCTCFRGFESGDGAGSVGTRGDCGAVQANTAKKK